MATVEDLMTVEDLIKELKRFSGKKLPVVIHNQTGLPFTYAITGVVSARNFDVAHLFDKTRGLPTEDRVYLLVDIVPEA